MKYIKLPVAIEAQQFTDEMKDRVYRWASEKQTNIYPTKDEYGHPILVIPTLEGEMICRINDYLIEEPFPTDDRKFYPCKPSIFKQTYALLPNDEKERLLLNKIINKKI